MLWFHGTLQTDADFSRITRPLYVTETLVRAAMYAEAEDWDAPPEAWEDGIPMKRGVVLVIRVTNPDILVEAPTPRLCECDPLDLAIRPGAVEGVDYHILARVPAERACDVGLAMLRSGRLTLEEEEGMAMRGSAPFYHFSPVRGLRELRPSPPRMAASEEDLHAAVRHQQKDENGLGMNFFRAAGSEVGLNWCFEPERETDPGGRVHHRLSLPWGSTQGRLAFFEAAAPAAASEPAARR